MIWEWWRKMVHGDTLDGERREARGERREARGERREEKQHVEGDAIIMPDRMEAIKGYTHHL